MLDEGQGSARFPSQRTAKRSIANNQTFEKRNMKHRNDFDTFENCDLNPGKEADLQEWPDTEQKQTFVGCKMNHREEAALQKFAF
jgi:hypothetical protein